MSGFLSRRRARALIVKECKQMLRDKSTLALGVILPVLLLLLFGYGLSMDVTLVPVAIVKDNSSQLTSDLFNELSGSPYFSPRIVHSQKEAEELLAKQEVRAIVRRSIHEQADGSEKVQVLVNGQDANNARISSRYLEGAIAIWIEGRSSGAGFSSPIRSASSDISTGRAQAIPHIWYNGELESRYFLVPGVTALILTLIGALLTSLVVAREWERGTWEALVASPANRLEVLMGKTVPYFLLGTIGLILCLCAAIWIFRVPIRGSALLLILCSAIYLIDALGMGLLISVATKSQVLASQVVLVSSFLPTLMLSGFIFDLRNIPVGVAYFSRLFPATWYVELLQTLFLVGNVPSILLKNSVVLLGFAILLFSLACKKLHKSLE